MIGRLSIDLASMRLRRRANYNRDPIMARRKKQSSKVQRTKGAKARPKAKKQSKAARGRAAAKRTVATAKPKRATAKKAARPVATAETVAVQVIERPAPDVITVTEVEETEVRTIRDGEE
jgi:hypothetical protein